MKHGKIHMPNLSYIAAFIIGVILFAMFWRILFGSASSLVVLAGMIGAATAVTLSGSEMKINIMERENNDIGFRRNTLASPTARI